MAWNQVATLKGPKGWGIANPVVEDGQLFVDVMDGTSVSEPHVLVGDVTGPVGPEGPAGPLPVVSASARTLAPGEQVEVNVGGTVAAPNLDFGIPRGDRGAKGEPGTPAPFPQWSMQAVSVAYGQAPRVEVSGVYPNQNVLLSIPQGAPGAATESIDDHSVSPESAYSSEKVETRLSESIVNEAPTGEASTTATWTQARILAVVADAVAALIDDGVTGEGSTWSSSRIRQAIDGKVNDSAPLSTTSVFSAGKVTELVEGAAVSAAWGSVSGKPSTFTPSAHSHSASEITSGVFTAARLPAASTSARGAVELATTAEAVAGTAQNLAVTPEGLAAALSLVVTGPQYVRQAKGQGTMTAWVVRVGPLVTFQGHIKGASNQALTAGYPFEGLQSITWALPKQDTILQAGLTMGRWGFRAVGVQSDGVFIVHEPAGTTSEPWTLQFFGSWFAADAV